MSVHNKKPTNSRIIVVGYTLSLLLFIVFIFIPSIFDIGLNAWFALFFTAILLGFVTSSVLPRSKNNTGFLWAGAILMLLSMICALDYYDESVSEYTGGFGAGNGFLLDGLNGMAYLIIVPLLVIMSYVLLMINTRKKYHRI